MTGIFIELVTYNFMSGLRQFLALSVVLLAYTLLKSNHKIIYILLTYIASSLHRSIIIFYPFTLIYFANRQNIIKFLLIFTAIPLMIYIYFDNILIFFPKYLSLYGEGGEYSGGFSFGIGFIKSFILFGLTLFLIIYHLIKKHYTKKMMFDVYFSILMLAWSMATNLLVYKIQVLARLSYYFGFFIILSVPLAVYGFKNKTFARYCVYALFILYYIYYINKYGALGIVNPYQFLG